MIIVHMLFQASGRVNELREPAKKILDGSSKLLNSGNSVHQELTTKNEAISAQKSSRIAAGLGFFEA